MNLIFALNYGARQEITKACQSIAQKAQKGLIDPNDISEDLIQQHLETYPLSDPDLILRTSGEFRLSNFLLWQAAYSEIMVSETLWPDFSLQELEQCFTFFSSRKRRFGGLSSSAAPQDNTSHLSFPI